MKLIWQWHDLWSELRTPPTEGTWKKPLIRMYRLSFINHKFRVSFAALVRTLPGVLYLFVLLSSKNYIIDNKNRCVKQIKKIIIYCAMISYLNHFPLWQNLVTLPSDDVFKWCSLEYGEMNVCPWFGKIKQANDKAWIHFRLFKII